jgi:acyl-CoA thioester hydrolase
MIQPAKIQVRFADLDVLGHVNNNIYLSYFEMARVHYFRQLLGVDWDWKSNGVVLAKNEVEYVRPVLLHMTPEIEMQTEHVGKKSFTLSYELTVNGTVFARGRSVMVAYNGLTQESIEVPEQMKEALKKIEKHEK